MAGIGQGDAAPVAKEQRLFQVRFQATDLLAAGDWVRCSSLAAL
jgi:hypothetical protein